MYHTLDICQTIADKLRQPEQVCVQVQEIVRREAFTSAQWADLTLMEGLPGIALFYGVLDQILPDQGWDQVAHTYLKLLLNKVEEQGINPCSLFEGSSGICFVIAFCSKQESRYQQVLHKLEAVLFAEIESLFRQVERFLDHDLDISPSFYNLTHGLSGILAYLLTRKENFYCRQLALDCVNRLILVLKRKRIVNGQYRRGWYVAPENQLADEEKMKYPQGSFILGLPYGVTGCLSILSIAALEGVQVPGQYELIHELSTWLKSKSGQSSKGIFWSHTLAFDEETCPQPHPFEMSRDTWNYGTPTVSRSLYLAAQATQDKVLKQFAEKAFLSVFSKTWQEWNLMGTSFLWGRAGLLALTCQMAQETHHPTLFKQMDILADGLKRFYDPSHPFGFQTVHVSNTGHYQWVDHPGLLNGAVGIALSLLMEHSKSQANWSKIFLIK
jgi:lantibiotic modifying enzyme